jgi:hypothetical protein
MCTAATEEKAERRVDEESREQKQRKINTLKRSARPFAVSSRREDKRLVRGEPRKSGAKACKWAVVHGVIGIGSLTGFGLLN